MIESKPSRNLSKFVFCGLVLFVLISVLCLNYSASRRLEIYFSHLQKNYLELFLDIEVASKKFKAVQIGDDDAHFENEKLIKVLREKINFDSVYSASWSYDGHHGMDTLKVMTEGYSYAPRSFHYQQSEGKKLFYGRSISGKELLVLEGFVKGSVKSRYVVVFELEKILSEINNSSR